MPHKKGVIRCALCYLPEKRGNRLSVSLCIYGDALARIRGGGGVRDLRDPLKKKTPHSNRCYSLCILL